jgi:hypothetical protein
MELVVANPKGFEYIDRKIHFGGLVTVSANTHLLEIGQVGTNVVAVSSLQYGDNNLIVFVSRNQYDRLKAGAIREDVQVVSGIITRATTNYPWLRP